MNRLSLLIPLAVFALILVIGYLGFSLDKRNELPSALIGQDFPEFSAPDLFSPDVVRTRADLVGQPTLVNIWATWCPTCKAEHEVLMQIARTSEVALVGVNYKDDRGLALGWLADYGNPYNLVLMDADGGLGVELGVYGAPETFLLNRDGKVIYKRVGDVNMRVWQNEIAPLLQQLEVAHGGPGWEMVGR